MLRTASIAALLALAVPAGARAAEPTAAPAPGDRPAPAPAAKANTARARRLDINTATRAELRTLPGVGETEAKQIVAGRPWKTKADLVTRGVLTEGRYASIRNRITLTLPANPRAKE